MSNQASLRTEIIAFSVALAAGVIGGFSVWAGVYGLGGLLFAITGLALFVFVIPGIAIKLNPSAQAVPGVVMFLLGLWMMGAAGELTVLSALGLAASIAWLLMPFVLIPMGADFDPEKIEADSQRYGS